jgi:hypothetical protein
MGFTDKLSGGGKVIASRQGRGSKPVERLLSPIGGQASSGRVVSHSAALSRSSERYRVRAGWL